jgi:hypothetical protein
MVLVFAAAALHRPRASNVLWVCLCTIVYKEFFVGRIERAK